MNQRTKITLGISRRAHNLEFIRVSRMKATLFAVGCMALLGLPDHRSTLTAAAALANYG